MIVLKSEKLDGKKQWHENQKKESVWDERMDANEKQREPCWLWLTKNERKRGARHRAYYLLLRLWYSVGSLRWWGHWPTLGFVYWCRVWWWCAAVGWPAFAVDCLAAFDSAVGLGLGLGATALVAVEMGVGLFLCLVNFVRHLVCFWLTTKILCVRIQLDGVSKCQCNFPNKCGKRQDLTVQQHQVVCVCVCLKFTDCCVCCWFCAVALAVVWFGCWFGCCCCCGWLVWPAAAFVALCVVRFPNEFAANGIDMFVPGIVNVAWPNAVARCEWPTKFRICVCVCVLWVLFSECVYVYECDVIILIFDFGWESVSCAPEPRWKNRKKKTKSRKCFMVSVSGKFVQQNVLISFPQCRSCLFPWNES